MLFLARNLRREAVAGVGIVLVGRERGTRSGCGAGLYLIIIEGIRLQEIAGVVVTADLYAGRPESLGSVPLRPQPMVVHGPLADSER